MTAAVPLPNPRNQISNYQSITEHLLPFTPSHTHSVHQTDKDRPSILKHTDFDTLLAGFLQQESDIKDLLILGSIPGAYHKEGHLDGLKSIGVRWMEECRLQHRVAMKYIQRMLSDDYPRYVK
jgi:hypothetical protein